MAYKDPAKQKDYDAKRYEKNKEKRKESKAKSREVRKQHAHDSITSGEIIDRNIWNVWCNIIRSGVKKHLYSDDFTNEMMFDMMSKGCFYCGDIATGIDRIDSILGHTPNNCVGCCKGCNKSKGAADPSTFIRKAYYRARGEYYDDDTNIWYVHKTKPTVYGYERNAKKKGVTFELTKQDFDVLIRSDCKYCQRSPITWFGVDRVIPSLGYVINNVVSCCFDCNNDKLEDDIDTMSERNERIAVRIDNGELVIDNREKVTLHIGTQSSSKKVCVRGKVYESQRTASTALGMKNGYVSECIRYKRYVDDIFEISDEFYEEYKDSELYITKKMYADTIS
jgi:5-methylcytosine-specific restriction endonuclease McrA